MWKSWLDRVGAAVGDAMIFRSVVKDGGALITICRDKENIAINSVIATCLALSDIQFAAQWKQR